MESIGNYVKYSTKMLIYLYQYLPFGSVVEQSSESPSIGCVKIFSKYWFPIAKIYIYTYVCGNEES